MAALFAAPLSAEGTLFQDDFESGSTSFTSIRRFRTPPSVITAAPEGHPQAFPPPSGRSVLRVDPNPEISGVGGVVGGPVVDRRDPSQPAVTLEAKLYLEDSTTLTANNMALIAADDSGTTVPSERYYRFGYRGEAVYFQMFDGRDFVGMVNDPALGAQLRVPGWHTFAMRFEGSEAIHLLVDGNEVGFSPQTDGSIPRVQVGLLVLNDVTDLPLLADDVRVYAPTPEGEPHEVIVEVEGSPAESGTFSFVDGRWQNSAGKSRAQGCTPGQPTRFIEGAEAGTAVFVPNVPASGLYEVFVTWCPSGNSADVLYTVKGGDGQSQITLDQDGWGAGGASNANRWISLGRFRLAAGTSNSISVTAQANSRATDGRNPRRVYADAVRIAPVTEAAPPPAPPVIAQVPAPPSPPAPAPAPAPAPPPPPGPDEIPLSTLLPANAAEIAWRTDAAIAQAESRRRGLRLIVYARSAQSRGCREMERDALTDRSVVQALNAAVPLRVDLDQTPELTTRFSLYRVPTVIVTDAAGNEVGRHIGAMSAQELLALITGE